MISIKDYIPQSVWLFMIEHRYIYSEHRKKHKEHLRKLLHAKKVNSLPIDNEEKWINKFNRLTYAYPELFEVGEAFVESEISILQDRPINKDEVIAICVAKNDLIKIKEFIRHHRTIGVRQFVILDNGSTDGSIEWLSKQEDVVLMYTKVPYTTNRREGWINRIMAYYGDERWYLVADSDELLVYEECEHKSIHDVIAYYELKKMIRGRALMVDMYAKPEYYAKGKKEDCFDECVYFDIDTYYQSKRYYVNLMCGGPRERIFHQAPWLTKYPLFYLRKQDIECKSHFLFPHRENMNTDCHLILKHYKFQPGEVEKYKKIVQDGSYFNGSKQYKAYLQVMENSEKLDFMYNHTEKYVSSKSLRKIIGYNAINWQ